MAFAWTELGFQQAQDWPAWTTGQQNAYLDLTSSADYIRFLIEQISTKDRKKDETGRQRTTGKFGTGFLTTHLLSEVVTVQGIAKEPGLPYREFDLLLDRTGFDLEEITEAVKTAKQSVEDLDDRPTSASYVSGAFNTAFRCSLIDALSLKVVKAGLADLDICLPYTLVFVREIESVEAVINVGKPIFV